MQINRQEKTENSYYISLANTLDNGIETALIIDDNFFILNGDWFDSYKKCKTKAEQINLFRENYEKFGSYTTDGLESLPQMY